MAIFPPATIGVLGGGQLGQFLLLSLRRQGYRTVVWDPDPLCPARRVADAHMCLPYDSDTACRDFSSLCDAATTEFENVPVLLLRRLSEHMLISPSADSVQICSHRILEKDFLKKNGFPVVDHYVVSSLEDCHSVPDDFFPAILKTAQLGYDGHGQVRVLSSQQLEEKWASFSVPCVLEKQLSSSLREFSVVLGRSSTKKLVLFPMTENIHQNGILLSSHTVPDLHEEIRDTISSLASDIARAFDYCGVLSVEFFYDAGQLYVNEMAPRPHNTGHYTLDALSYSQFDCQQKILCGLDLPSPHVLSHAAMVNLLGCGWPPSGEPDWLRLLDSGGQLYWYGKQEVRSRRKMGHVTWVGDCEDVRLSARTFLSWFYQT